MDNLSGQCDLLEASGKKDAEPEAEADTPKFNTSRFAPGCDAISRSDLDSAITRIVGKWNGDSQTVVVAPTFNALPAPILAYAKKQGYDNTSANERITGVAYRGKVYLIQENIPSVEVATQ